MYVNGKLLAQQPAVMGRTFIFQVEGSGRLNGDSLNARIENVHVAVGDAENNYGTYSGWVYQEEHYGLHIAKTKPGEVVDTMGPAYTDGALTDGQSFAFTGTVQAPQGEDWDNCIARRGHPMSALVYIPQRG